ncbi:MAG: DUF2243 domain-containing protein [Akkermansiaceae bacterium]
MDDKRAGPLIAAATFLGLGLGGFIDGILLHQILQWHQMLSNILPPDTLENAKVNMFWDGIFHAGTWVLTFVGVMLLWRLLGRGGGVFSKLVFFGGLIFGWGVFNIMDSVFNHYLFAFHNVREEVANPQRWNHGFLVFGLAQAIAGWVMIRRGQGRRTDSQIS